MLFGSAAAASFTVNAAGTSIVAYAPAALAGTVDITVTTPLGTSPVIRPDEYTYLGPAVSSIAPASGPGAGGTKVTIHGSALIGANQVLFGAAAATELHRQRRRDFHHRLRARCFGRHRRHHGHHPGRYERRRPS